MSEQEESMKVAGILHKRMLNQTGLSKLIERGIYKKLVLALGLSDVIELERRNIYFNPVFSPASINDLSIDLPKGSKIITLDINTLKLFASNEAVAMILHEIGHAMNSEIKGEHGEYCADQYAVDRNYGNFILSSLEKAREVRPNEFDIEITNKRIERLKQKR